MHVQVAGRARHPAQPAELLLAVRDPIGGEDAFHGEQRSISGKTYLLNIAEGAHLFDPNVFDELLLSAKLEFKGLSDFGVKGITAQSEFLKDLTNQKEQSLKIIKQLKSNKMLRKALENEDSKGALLNAMYALIKEIEEWMDEHKFKKLKDFRGKLTFAHTEDPDVYLRQGRSRS